MITPEWYIDNYYYLLSCVFFVPSCPSFCYYNNRWICNSDESSLSHFEWISTFSFDSNIYDLNHYVRDEAHRAHMWTAASILTCASIARSILLTFFVLLWSSNLWYTWTQFHLWKYISYNSRLYKTDSIINLCIFFVVCLTHHFVFVHILSMQRVCKQVGEPLSDFFGLVILFIRDGWLDANANNPYDGRYRRFVRQQYLLLFVEADVFGQTTNERTSRYYGWFDGNMRLIFNKNNKGINNGTK